MKEVKDREQLNHYLKAHQIESIFNEQLMPHLSLYSFDQGDLICTQGQAAQYLYVLVKGKVKIFTTSAEGKTLILSFKTPLEAIGDIEYVRGTDIMNTVEAVSPVYMIRVHYSWLNKYAGDAANLIGTSYRHMNRVIQKLCKEGLVERSKGFIHVKDREGLSSLVSQNIYE
jgi:CRP-like cAMP-binding protein